jgi:uncharacterized protein
MLIETALNQACAQFNAGDFYACHETLEPLWLAASGTERTYWHALIQAAVALHHHQRGNLKGATSVYHRAAEKLSVLPKGFGAIDAEALADSLHSFFTNADAETSRSYPILKMR